MKLIFKSLNKIACWCFVFVTVTTANAQWSPSGVAGSVWGNGSLVPIASQWHSFGFGDFVTAASSPKARVHINEFYLPSPWTGTNGEIFRTDGSDSKNNAWRLFTGSTATTATEKFSVLSYSPGTGFNGHEVSLLGVAAECEIYWQQAQMSFKMRGKTLGFFSENFGATPDDVILGDGTDVNTNIRAVPSGLGSNNLFLHGATGKVGIGPYDGVNVPPAKLSVFGAIQSTFPLLPTVGGLSTRGTILFGYAPETGNPATAATDGFRIAYDNNFSAVNNDALVFEKTDINSADPDGNIAFTNTGNDGIEELSMIVSGVGRVGVGKNYNAAFPVANRFVIDSDPTDPSLSGLRFVDLLSTATPISNPGAGVLAVNANGDVVYVNGTGIGNYCGATTPNPLVTNDYEIPLNTKNYRFTGQAIPYNAATSTNSDVVGIGYACGTPMPAKLSVLQAVGSASVNTAAGAFTNQDLAPPNFPLVYKGVGGIANGAQLYGTTTNIGGDFLGASAGTNIGVRGRANAATAFSNVNHGGDFTALSVTSNGTNYGVFAQAGNGVNNYAVYGVSGTPGTPGPGPVPGPNYAGYFNGDVVITGTYGGPSDIKLKEKIQNLSGALEIISKLHPKTYEFKQSSYPSMNLPKGKQYGLIAQEVESLLPTLVTNNVQPAVLDESGNTLIKSVDFKTVQYTQLIPFLILGMQEQQAVIDEQKKTAANQDAVNKNLQDQISKLTDLINSCCSNQQSGTQSKSKQINVDLVGGQSIILDQNVPNPFAEQTTIKYFLPDNVGKAQILFYDAQGKLIQAVDLTQKGSGSVNVFAQDLSSGTYVYTLVADGKIIETKKMVKQ